MTALLARLRARLRSYLERQQRSREECEDQCRHDGSPPRCLACVVNSHLFD